MDHCKLWLLAHAFKCEHIFYLLNLKDICMFSHLIMCSWLGIPVRVLRPGQLFREMQYFEKDIELFTNLTKRFRLWRNQVLELENIWKKYLWKSDILRKDTSQDWSWTALSMFLSIEIIAIVLKYRNNIIWVFWHNALRAISVLSIRNMFCWLWCNLFLHGS